MIIEVVTLAWLIERIQLSTHVEGAQFFGLNFLKNDQNDVFINVQYVNYLKLEVLTL